MVNDGHKYIVILNCWGARHWHHPDGHPDSPKHIRQVYALTEHKGIWNPASGGGWLYNSTLTVADVPIAVFYMHLEQYMFFMRISTAYIYVHKYLEVHPWFVTGNIRHRYKGSSATLQGLSPWPT